MELTFKGRTALVTGASQGIGRATARMLAGSGAAVVGVARRKELVERAAEGIDPARGGRLIALAADLYDEGSPARVVAEALRLLGRIDILVNAAGASRPLGLEATPEQWDEGMVLNFIRVRELTHAVVPGMSQNGWGRVITFTGSSEPRALNAAIAAKAAVHAWAKGLSCVVAKSGVTVNCIKPGRIHSEQISRMHPTPESEREYARTEIPMGRFGEPEEIAPLALFLASEQAGYITGTVIPVDGGSSRLAF